MFHSEESNTAFRLQNNTVYKLQFTQFGTKFKHALDGKVNTHTSHVSGKQMNRKRSFNKAVIKHSCKTSFKDFGN